MARRTIGTAPFKVATLDIEGIVTLAAINSVLGSQKALSLCVRRESGPAQRGGYYFHFAIQRGLYKIYDFRKKEIDTVSADFFVRFVNHVSGRLFDPEIFDYCQKTINLKQD